MSPYNDICNGAWAAIRVAQYSRRKVSVEVFVFVLTWEQRDELRFTEAPSGPFRAGVDGAPDTLFGIPLMYASRDWPCPSNLTDLRGVR
jgi:hypothetical protein